MPRSRVPDYMHRHRGTFRADRHGRGVPGELGEPEMPKYLGAVEREEWRRLAALALELGTLAVSDGPTLEATCCAYGDWRRFRKIASGRDAFARVSTKHGAVMSRAHPAVAAAADAWRRYVSGLDRFGLNPTSREKARQAPNARDNEPLSLESFIRSA